MKVSNLHYFALSFVLLVGASSAALDFEEVYKWKQIEYNYPTSEDRANAIENGTFNAGQIQPIDAQYTYESKTNRERIFITTPRLGDGIPASLGAVINETLDSNPVIDPYPSWSWHQNLEECNYHRIVSVFRVWADECERLWVLDNGLMGATFTCTPQLLVFDLKTDELLYKYEIPYDQYKNTSWFVTPVVEVESTSSSCLDSWVYVADPATPSLLVYSLEQNTSWSVQDDSFEHDSEYDNYTIAGDSFSVTDGLLFMALEPKTNSSNGRKLFYHAMSNNKESWVYTADLKNASNFETPDASPDLFNTFSNGRSQQSAGEAMDANGNLYFSLLEDIQLAKWNIQTEYQQENFEIVANNTETMQFPSGFKVIPYQGGSTEVLWVFATSFQRFAAGKMNGNDTRIRLFSATL